MAPRALTAQGGEGRMIRTTLLLPEELWRQAKMRAIDEGDLRTVMIRALEEYLARPPRPKARSEEKEHDEARRRMVENLSRTVEQWQLSPRSARRLQEMKIKYVYQLVEKTSEEMLEGKNFGQRSLNEIKEILTGMGFSLGMKLKGVPVGEDARRLAAKGVER